MKILILLLFVSTDVLGIVISSDDVTQITTKTTNRQVCDFGGIFLMMSKISSPALVFFPY